MNRFNKFIRDGGHEGEEGYGPPVSTSQASTSTSIRNANHTPKLEQGAPVHTKEDKKGKGKLKGKNTHPFDLVTAIHESELTTLVGKEENVKHRFEVSIEPAAFTEEKFNLYKKYQTTVHGDKESKVTEDGFIRFLCDSPLEVCTRLENHDTASEHCLLLILEEHYAA